MTSGTDGVTRDNVTTDNVTTEIVRDTTRSIVGTWAASTTAGSALDAEFGAEVWSALEAAGLHLIGVEEQRGGAGGSWLDAQAALEVTAGHAVPVPLAEALFGLVPAIGALERELTGDLGALGLVAAGSFAATTTVVATRRPGQWVLDGVLGRVPFGRYATHAVVAAPSSAADGSSVLAVCPVAAAPVTPGLNVAGEPRDDLAFVDTPARAAVVIDAAVVDRLRGLAALARAIQTAAAAEAALTMTIRYANEREQFGRPIARFQAVAQQIAVMTGEVAVAAAAVGAAVAALDTPAERWAVAVAKARTAATAGLLARTTHQIFGALGFTQEHALHRLTRRLWSWRDEVGRVEQWQRRVGENVFEAGSDQLWALLTGIGPAGAGPAEVSR